jgi:hypothetical protein
VSTTQFFVFLHELTYALLPWNHLLPPVSEFRFSVPEYIAVAVPDAEVEPEGCLSEKSVNLTQFFVFCDGITYTPQL